MFFPSLVIAALQPIQHPDKPDKLSIITPRGQYDEGKGLFLLPPIVFDDDTLPSLLDGLKGDTNDEDDRGLHCGKFESIEIIGSWMNFAMLPRK